MRPLIIDFETRSRVDLTQCGTSVYVRDPSTQVLCIGYQFEGQTHVTPLLRRSAMPLRVRRALAQDDVILVAHSALFERAVWTHVLAWPEEPPERWYCTSNLAGLYNLPQALGTLTQYLWPNDEAAQKDKRGRQLINLLSKPNRSGGFNEDPNLLDEMYAYCAQDVKVTAKIHTLLPPAIPGERRIQIADIMANERGYQVDREFCEAAKTVDQKLQGKVIDDCVGLTGLRPTQTTKLRVWLAERGCELPDMSRQTIEARLRTDELLPLIRQVLELRIAGARGSTQKFQSLLRQSTPDFPRITHHTKYAAGNTARWIARGAQIHNFRSRNLISYDLLRVKREVMTDTLPKDVDIRNYVGGAVRAAIVAAPGKHLALGDYSGMENRMLMYLSGEARQLGLIRNGLDVYRDLATRVFGIPNPAAIDPWQRQICKHMVLGLGFGMGALAFFVNLKFKFQVDLNRSICHAIVGSELNELTEKYIARLKDNPRLLRHTCEMVCLDNLPLTRQAVMGLVTTTYLVQLFRRDFSAMSEWWRTLDLSFRELMDSPSGTTIPLDPACHMHRRKTAIIFELPSGRPMYYWRPRFRGTRDAITDEWVSELVYDQATGGSMKTLKGYGARFGANLVQGLSRDIMADAFADLAEHPDYDPVVTVHDEVISETENDDPKVYEQAILDSAAARAWVRPIPLKVDADISPCWLSKG